MELKDFSIEIVNRKEEEKRRKEKRTREERDRGRRKEKRGNREWGEKWSNDSNSKNKSEEVVLSKNERVENNMKMNFFSHVEMLM